MRTLTSIDMQKLLSEFQDLWDRRIHEAGSAVLARLLDGAPATLHLNSETVFLTNVWRWAGTGGIFARFLVRRATATEFVRIESLESVSLPDDESLALLQRLDESTDSVTPMLEMADGRTLADLFLIEGRLATTSIEEDASILVRVERFLGPMFLLEEEAETFDPIFQVRAVEGGGVAGNRRLRELDILDQEEA